MQKWQRWIHKGTLNCLIGCELDINESKKRISNAGKRMNDQNLISLKGL